MPGYKILLRTLLRSIAGWLPLACGCFSIICLLVAGSQSFAEELSVTLPDKGETTAQVSEQQVREVLLDILSQQNTAATDDVATNAQRSAFTATYHEFAEFKKVAGRLQELLLKLPYFWDEFKAAFARSTTPEEGFNGWQVVITIVMHLALGLILEYVATKPLLKRLYQYAETQEKTFVLKLKFVATRISIQMMGLAVLAFATYACAFFYLRQNTYFERLFLEFLSAFVFFRCSMLISRSILSPYFQPLRLLKLSGGTARRLYYWSIAFFSFYTFESFLLTYLTAAEMEEILITALLIPMSIVLNLIILIAVWGLRERITAMFVDKGSETYQNSFVVRFTAQFWPYFFTVWLAIIWLLWQYRNLQGRPEMAEGVGIAWVITLIFPIADRLFNALLKNIVRIPWLQSPGFEKRSGRFIQIVQTGFRIILFAFSIVTLLNSWGIHTTDMMMTVEHDGIGSKIVDFLVIGTLVYVFWELVHALIERKLPEEEDALASLEGEGGGAGASRSETLLPLIRTTLSVILAIFFIISLLHLSGVAIAPLLAGAGVVGIAIGFGAQKLVQDILGGAFFLIDDAFRKGEYIELEDLRGTVEKISLRSMQLRHHLGAVQTVPYSEIKTVKNLSRDWITMKLELRLPYNTDIEKVRKIIKKVGQAMLQDEQLGPSFILPLKSQGVMRMEESALIIRMKFTSKPGEQWVIRREAYRRVRDALSEAGIHFAHREVRVLLPEDMHEDASRNSGKQADTLPAQPVATDPETGSTGGIDHNKLRTAATAAVTSMLAAEATRHAMRDDDMNHGGDDR